MMRLKTPKLDRESVRHLTDTHPAQLTPEAIDGCQEELFENPMIRRNPTRRLQTASSFHADGPFFRGPLLRRRANEGQKRVTANVVFQGAAN
jgi:hypothetical protein